MDVVTLALARKYTKNSLIGLGAIKGAPCVIKSIIPEYSEVDPSVVVGNTITFEWTSNDGEIKNESYFTTENGRGIFEIKLDHSDEELHYYNVKFYDGTTDSFEIPRAPKGEKGDPGKSGVYIGEEEPDDLDINVWINPNDGYVFPDGIATADDIKSQIQQKGDAIISYIDQERENLKGDKGDDGKSGVYVGEEEPDDPDINVWVNPNGDGTIDINSISGLKEIVENQVETEIIDVLPSEIKKVTVPKPEETPVVGKVLKVKTVNTDGTFTSEWADESNPDLTDYVKNTDWATSTSGGVIMGGSRGFNVNNSGKPFVASLTKAQYESSDAYTFIGKGSLETVKDDLVERALGADISDDSPIYAEAEQANACERIGAVSNSALMDAGIKSISWTTNVEGTFTTVDDPLKAQRPAGTNLRYWVEMDSSPRPYHHKLYRVTFNDEVYDNLVCKSALLIDEEKGSVIGSDTTIGGFWLTLGNKYLYDSRYPDTGEPFCLIHVEHSGMHDGGAYYYSSTVGHAILFTRSAMNVNLKIETATIEQDLLPRSLNEMNYGVGDEIYDTVPSSTYARASWGQGNIVGRASFTSGISNICNGYSSNAIGYNNDVAGDYAVAIGSSNMASGKTSFASGVRNVSSGYASQAFGYRNTASGESAVAIGQMTIASGNKSFAGGSYIQGYGYTTASGQQSFAFGASCATSGNSSIALGQVAKAQANISQSFGDFTVANGRCQHVTGRYNIIDENAVDTSHGSGARKYLSIVGNGTAETKRSNAHTLDWDGNAWYQGDVYVGGTEQSNGVKLLKETDLPDITESEILASLGLGA